MSVPSDPAAGTNEAADREAELAHLTGWFRQRPTAFEFWEVVVTDRRLYRCRVGESFKSLLLRADVGERGRARVEEATPDELLGLNDANAAIPLSALRRISLRDGSLVRRAELTLSWVTDDGDETTWELHCTSASDVQMDVVESLARDDRLSHVDVDVRSSGRFF